ncbi:hypothetical protein BD410DRAFT_789599, partial [Rickenella mellea]
MLDLAEEMLPVGPKGWKLLGARHREWAREKKKKDLRTDASLELKYKTVRCILLVHINFTYLS